MIENEEGIDVLLKITLKGNGKGFDQERVMQAHGLGMRELDLFGIRKRLALFDGTLSFESVPGRGTILTARILLNGTATEGIPSKRSRSSSRMITSL